jgi:hypothetical protein
MGCALLIRLVSREIHVQWHSIKPFIAFEDMKEWNSVETTKGKCHIKPKS